MLRIRVAADNFGLASDAFSGPRREVRPVRSCAAEQVAAVQQDTALAAFLGIAHAERNGQHYVDGFADTPQDEARRFLNAHSDLYEEAAGTMQLKIRDGTLAIGSLAQPGFASASIRVPLARSRLNTTCLLPAPLRRNSACCRPFR
jgi:hypothetical protein